MKANVCCLANVARFQFTTADVDTFHRVILEHNCDCGSCCRRVALWQEPTPLAAADDWTVKAIARVTFGCRKICVGSHVEVDIKTGVILDLMGDGIAVDIMPVEVEGTPPELTFGAMSTCCGAGGARGCATRTTGKYLLSAATNDIIVPIPPYAYAVSFATNNPEGFFTATTDIAQLGSGLSETLVTADGTSIADPWMLVGGAQSIGVTMPIVGEGTQELELVFLIGI